MCRQYMVERKREQWKSYVVSLGSLLTDGDGVAKPFWKVIYEYPEMNNPLLKNSTFNLWLWGEPIEFIIILSDKRHLPELIRKEGLWSIIRTL